MQDLEHQTVSSGDLRLHVVTAGPEDGPPCLLLHGFPEFWYGWRHQIAPLAAAGFRVLVPDQRGYAESDKPRGVAAYRLDRIAADAVGVLSAFGFQRAHVVAHDWGGAAAWYLAAARPEAVDRLVVLNVPHPVVMRRHLRSSWSQMKRSWYIFFFQLPWLPERWIRGNDFLNLKKSLRGSAGPGTFSDEDLDRYVEAASRPGALTGMLNWYRAAFRKPPPRPESWRVSAPTRVVWGRKDIAIGEEMVEPSIALCDEGDLRFVDSAGHFVQHEEPDRVTDLVLEHLGRPGTLG